MIALGRRQWMMAMGGIASMASIRASALSPVPGTSVVYHVSEGLEQGKRAMGFVINHLEADSEAHIAVLAHSEGIRCLFLGVENSQAAEFMSIVTELKGRGVQFVACGISLSKFRLGVSALIPGVEVVPAGVVELARLQAQEHYAYIKP
jgi:intracellular sulfur oxidation DsrE/DsrF family protein